ncbi:MAG: alanine racemase [Myxococcota bacterium]
MSRLPPRFQSLQGSLRPTRAEVSLEAIAHNYREVRRVVGVPVLAVVKADAYGHGVVSVARRLAREGAASFGVALAEEGLELRAAGIRRPILVLNGVYGGAYQDVLDAELTPVVYDLDTVAAFAAVDPAFAFHLKIDTGMSRLGVSHRALPMFLAGLERFPRVIIRGVMTHLAAADTDPEFTALQLDRFDGAVDAIRRRGHEPTTVHAANSAGALLSPRARYDMVRPGIALYGAAPFSHGLTLRPTLRLRTEIIRVAEIEPGDSVGYDRTFVAKAPCRIATLPIGYGDGLLFRSEQARVALVKGVRCPIVGRVSMDLSAVDITAVSATVGDEVVLLGRQGNAEIQAEELAAGSGTIPYEVLTSVSRRVPRAYST